MKLGKLRSFSWISGKKEIKSYSIYTSLGDWLPNISWNQRGMNISFSTLLLLYYKDYCLSKSKLESPYVRFIFEAFKHIYIHVSCVIIIHCILISINFTISNQHLVFNWNVDFSPGQLFMVIVLVLYLFDDCKSISINCIKSNCIGLFDYWLNLKFYCTYLHIRFYCLNECIMNHHSCFSKNWNQFNVKDIREKRCYTSFFIHRIIIIDNCISLVFGILHLSLTQ